MLWIPMYLQMVNGYSDYETATASSTYDIGNVLGAVMIGYITDLTYSRRTPVAVLCIILASVMQFCLTLIPPHLRVLFYVYIFV